MLKIELKNLLRIKLLKAAIVFFVIFFSLFLITTHYLQERLIDIYEEQNSVLIKDREGKIISMRQNEKGYWAKYLEEIPKTLKELLIKKEDKYFFNHFGFNPWSTFQASIGYLGLGPRRASSTITQQLVKILLETESERNLKNKIIEALYTLSLEIYQSKETILKMYANSIYFGNQAQGLSEASHLYFNLSPELLTDGQTLQLLTSISSPTGNNPSKVKNKDTALFLAQRLGLNEEELILTDPLSIKENMENYSHSTNSYFELEGLIDNLSENQQVTLDKEISEKIREIVKRNVEELKVKDVKNGAVVVIKLPENEVLALIGSPNPLSFEEGYQINMLKEPRPIGSTIKPFVYLKAFEKGLRPYTLVDDREYKYLTAIGFPLYPKNFDYKYRGEVTLHYALSNSLNVPAVKVLEYVGLEEFYRFLDLDLQFEPVQSLNNYQLGIALGVLEMSLFDLSSYFTIFPNEGVLKEVKIFKDGQNLSLEKRIAEPQYIQLVNKILSDRITGVEQFGLKSELNLFQKNYALKTGTSRDFRDSWVIGYTPDFLVGTWLGNSDNTPMDQVSGQLGAGRIWAETMELLLNSEYNKKTPFDFNLLKEFYNKNTIQYGLPDDDYEKSLIALNEENTSLIFNPHNGDNFLFEENTKIFLKAKEMVEWFINNEFWDKEQESIFIPQKAGQYQIKAKTGNKEEEITIYLISK